MRIRIIPVKKYVRCAVPMIAPNVMDLKYKHIG